VIYSFELICNVLPIENVLVAPRRMHDVIRYAQRRCCSFLFGAWRPGAREHLFLDRYAQLPYVIVMLLVSVLPVLAYGRVASGSISDEAIPPLLPAPPARPSPARPPRHSRVRLSPRVLAQLESRHPRDALVAAMNGMITVAVLLTYPVQFYPAIQVIALHNIA
jgi:hypothetical protein